MFNSGLVSVSFRQNSPKEILEEMQKANLKYIEWGSDVHAPCDDLQKLREIKELQENMGIVCTSYGTYFKLGITPLEELSAYVSAAKVLGTNVLRLWAGNKGYNEYNLAEKQAFFEVCKAAARIAEENGAVLCMECHNGTFTDCKEGALELINTVNSKHFAMFWQPNQYKTVPENIQYAKAVSGCTYNIHVFNWNGNNAYPLADGIETWKRYLSCFNGNHACLLEFMPNGGIELLCREAAALHSIIEQEVYTYRK